MQAAETDVISCNKASGAPTASMAVATNWGEHCATDGRIAEEPRGERACVRPSSDSPIVDCTHRVFDCAPDHPDLYSDRNDTPGESRAHGRYRVAHHFTAGTCGRKQRNTGDAFFVGCQVVFGQRTSRLRRSRDASARIFARSSQEG